VSNVHPVTMKTAVLCLLSADYLPPELFFLCTMFFGGV